MALSSNKALLIPRDAPEPANPTKWRLPMLLANKELPTCEGKESKIKVNTNKIR